MAPVERIYVAMGTTIRFLVYHDDPREALAAVHEAHDLVMRVHALMSVQESGSDLSVWNRANLHDVVDFDPLTVSAVDEALTYRRLTAARFDPTIGAAIPNQGHAVEVPVDDRTLEWDRGRGILLRQSTQVQLDLGGSAKGWAVDQAVDILRKRGVCSALVNAGGDLFVLGTPPEGNAWRIGVRRPDTGNHVAAEMDLRDCAVATSGGYERQGSTIVDPRDFHPIRFSGSTTVIAPRCGMADCLSTAAFVDRDVPLPPEAHLLTACPLDDGLQVSTSTGFPYELVSFDQPSGASVRRAAPANR